MAVFQSNANALANALDLYYKCTPMFLFFFFIYQPLFSDLRNRSQANFSRTCPSAWITKLDTQISKICRGVAVGVKMSKNFDFRPTLPPQTPTPRRSRSAYQSPELTWHVPIISVPNSNNCTKIPSATGRSSLARLLHISLDSTFSGSLVSLEWLKLDASSLV